MRLWARHYVMEGTGGPAWIRTRDQGIMSPFHPTLEWREVAVNGGKWRENNGIQISVDDSQNASTATIPNYSHKSAHGSPQFFDLTPTSK